MTIKKGDCVRVEFEATIHSDEDEGGFTVISPHGASYWIPEEYMTKTLPTKKYAIIRIASYDGYTWVFERYADDRWLETGKSEAMSDGYVLSIVERHGGFSVVYEGND